MSDLHALVDRRSYQGLQIFEEKEDSEEQPALVRWMAELVALSAKTCDFSNRLVLLATKTSFTSTF